MAKHRLNIAVSVALALLAGVCQPATAAEAKCTKYDVEGLIASLDAGKDGKISRDEWKARGVSDNAYMAIGQGRDPMSTDDFRAAKPEPAVDANGDCTITLQEFQAFDKMMAAGSPGGPGGAPDGMQGGMPGGAPGGMPPGMNSAADIKYTSAIEIKDGVYLADKVTSSAVSGKKVGNHSASGIKITSKTDKFNGVYVHGSKSSFILSDSEIKLSGKGLSDFDGISAGVLSREGANLTLKNVRITTSGVVSTAVTATDDSVMKVYNSTLVVNGGPVPSGYVRKIGPGMMEPPTPLGIVGTARASLTMGSAKSYFYDSTIIAEGWGALSTDAARGAYLEANNCDIRVLKSGYGTYADNGAKVVINNSKMATATFNGIIAGQASIAFNNLNATSDGNSVMIHNVMGSTAEVGELTIKGGKIATSNAVVLVKSANADITIDGAKLSSKNGDLILSVINDDSNATKVNGQKVAGIKANVKNANLEGNILHQDTDRTMSVAFTNASLKGAMKDVSLSLDANSKWTATADSKVTLVGSIDVAKIDAPAGITISAVAGEGSNLTGSYKLAHGGILRVKAN